MYLSSAMITDPLSLYIHIPFCVKKCLYCDFLSSPSDEETMEMYVDALAREIAASAAVPANEPVDTVFFGGGTPSLLKTQLLEKLMDSLRDHFYILPGAEISMECNPGTVDAEKLCALKEMGINRLSFGVQSFHNDELRRLGRIHTAEEAKKCFLMARDAGFSNINIDLMSAIPGQTAGSWRDNLHTAAELGPEHISAYSLIIEEGTPYASMMEQGALPDVPDEDTDRQIYHETLRILAEHGYARYEISNYAKPGRECRHNIGYWTGKEYLGLGLGASSLINGHRFHVTRSLKEYMDLLLNTDDKAGQIPAETWKQPWYKEIETLSETDRMSEFFFLGLRMTEGVSEGGFFHRFHRKAEDIFGEPIRKHMANGLLERGGGKIFLTTRGLDLANYVMCDFLL